ncbi:3'-5' exonuclease [archaeon]|nr:3'-5' exonuclease [archaeon]
MKNLQLIKSVVFIDVETTGLNTQQDRIVDICITKVKPDGNEESLSSLINPGIPIPIESTQIHGITDVDVAEKPTFRDIAPEIFNFIQDCDIGGFGISKFDLFVLESEFKRAGINYSRQGKQIIDVQTIYHKLEPRDLSAAYTKYCGKSLENAHRAHIDVRATIDVLESQLEQNGDLPRDVIGLNKFCNPKDPTWIDDDGKLAWFKGEAIINFGVHKGKTLEFMYKNEPGYLQWIISKDFSPKVKGMAENGIKGKFPKHA